jgi:hypothetical protein
MVPLQHFATRVVAEVIRRQPPSRERTTLAWQIAVGPALARWTTVDLEEGVLTVRARDPRWSAEVTRASGTIVSRMQNLLGPTTVSRIRIAD